MINFYLKKYIFKNVKTLSEPNLTQIGNSTMSIKSEVILVRLN